MSNTISFKTWAIFVIRYLLVVYVFLLSYTENKNKTKIIIVIILPPPKKRLTKGFLSVEVVEEFVLTGELAVREYGRADDGVEVSTVLGVMVIIGGGWPVPARARIRILSWSVV